MPASTAASPIACHHATWGRGSNRRDAVHAVQASVVANPQTIRRPDGDSRSSGNEVELVASGVGADDRSHPPVLEYTIELLATQVVPSVPTGTVCGRGLGPRTFLARCP